MAYKGAGEPSSGDRNVLYLHCGNGDTGIDLCQDQIVHIKINFTCVNYTSLKFIFTKIFYLR